MLASIRARRTLPARLFAHPVYSLRKPCYTLHSTSCPISLASNASSSTKSSCLKPNQRRYSSIMAASARDVSTSAVLDQQDVPTVKIELNETESRLRKLLLDVAKFINPENPPELRWAGGWVRDKILGSQSHDVDVAINAMTGETFGKHMDRYLKVPGNAEMYGAEGVVMHIVKANPEKSKHLETATTKVFGLDVDLVNLRKETYTETSRNPIMEFGTPTEDALRRDATINALFYNLQTDLVEDFTKQGLADKDRKIIRTPLEPYQTFMDDPLRVLRLIRFAARLGWTIDTTTQRAMNDERIRKAFMSKITRERVGVEIEKMLAGPRPLVALELLNEVGFFAPVFTDPTASHKYQPDPKLWPVAYHTAEQILGGQYPTLADVVAGTKEAQYLLWVLTSVVPWMDVPLPEAPSAKKRPPPPVQTLVVREGIKAPNKVCDIVTSAVLHLEQVRSFKDRCVKAKRLPASRGDPNAAVSREVLGMSIRRWGASWRSQVGLAAMVEVAQAERSEHNILEEYESFLKTATELDLLSAYNEKPLLDGNALAKALGAGPGPWMKDALDVVMEYQLANPGSASSEGAIAAVEQRKGELAHRLVRHFLQLTIRPMFAKTNSSQVTAQGRRAISPRPRKSAGIEDESTTRPWKSVANQHVIPLLRWCVSALDERRSEDFWPLLVPPILSLIDDMEVRYKVIGCGCLRELLSATSPTMLQRTGLGPVFQEALGPSLSYLPTLTPEAESIDMLNAAYPALLQLGESLSSGGRPPAQLQGSRSQERLLEDAPAGPRARGSPNVHLAAFYNDVLRQHVFPSCAHVEDAHPSVLSVLLVHLSTVVQRLGIDSVGHLQHNIRLIAHILNNPFSIGSSDPAVRALQALKVIIAQGWPRMHVWRMEVMQGLCNMWINVIERTADCAKPAAAAAAAAEQEEEGERVKRGLRECASLTMAAADASAKLCAADGADGDGKQDQDAEVPMSTEAELLVQADGRLRELLQA